MNIAKKTYNEYNNLEAELEETNMLLEFVELGESSFEVELEEKMKSVSKEIENFKIKLLLDEEYDANDSILTINAGAGGTEACDWAEMLYRMYTRWATKNEYEVKELDYLEGEEAGIKSVTFEIIGQNAYGYMKSEKGVHRLVRISPSPASPLPYSIGIRICSTFPKVR